MIASKLIQNLKCLSCLLLLCSSGSLWAGDRAEREFWTAEKEKKDAPSSGITAFPGESWVEAGPVAYGNYGGRLDDEWAAAFKIEASFRDWSDFLHLRLNGLLGLGGTAEGLAEAQLVLLDGLVLGAGVSYTERLKTTGRFGLYVQDKNESRRRGGIYLLTQKGGGIELSWPVVERWSVWGDIGEEDDGGDKYHRAILGMMYSF